MAYFNEVSNYTDAKDQQIRVAMIHGQFPEIPLAPGSRAVLRHPEIVPGVAYKAKPCDGREPIEVPVGTRMLIAAMKNDDRICSIENGPAVGLCLQVDRAHLQQLY